MLKNSCEVCGQNAHGLHFDVRTCRACAAFFRRYANSKLVNAKCLRRIGDCDKCFCRPCRLQKCMKVGMDSKKFQYNRDAILPFTKASISPSVASFTGQPGFAMFKNPMCSKAKSFLDVHHLVSEASRLLNLGLETPLYAKSQLKKLSISSNVLKFNTNELKVFDKFGKEEFVDIVEFYFFTVLKWIIQFEEFQKLERNDQMTLLYSIWVVWMKFHKCSSTADFRRNNKNWKPTHVVMRNMCMDREKGHKFLDTSWMSDYPHEYVAVYMNSQNIYELDVTDAILKLDPTDVELTYMYAQACFEYTGNRFHGKIQEITDHFQDILSNDLHNYYIKEMNNPRYSHRLAEMMKVNNLVQKSIWESRPQRELNKVFDVIKIGFSHPEMFDDSEFCS